MSNLTEHITLYTSTKKIEIIQSYREATYTHVDMLVHGAMDI